ncbi:MAG: hypothetical protein HZB39_09940 [Planctomycetes bacterium]|nr:hypothetical protein [Planctomycetota bacterium]
MRAVVIAFVACSFVVGPSGQESYWISATGGVKQVDCAGVVRQAVTPAATRDVVVAPDGKVWYLAAGITIKNPDGTPFTTIAVSAGSPYAIAFDAQGHAWVSASAGVEEFDALGASLGVIALPALQARVIAVDAQGNKWIAHRLGPPGSLSRIDGVTRAVTSHPMPAGSLILPITVFADARGLFVPSHLWVVGDNRGAGELVEFDAAGNPLNTYVLGSAARLQWMAGDVDASGVVANLWVGDWGNGDLYRVNAATGAFTVFPQGSGVKGVTFDGFGRLWLTIPTGGFLRRLDPATVTTEVNSAIAALTQLSTRWQHATVVDPTGDLDGDGFANTTEVSAGTSPFDAQSTPGLSLLTAGPTAIGTTTSIAIRNAVGAPALIVFSIAASSTGLPIPGLNGQFLLDLGTLLPVSLTMVGTTSLSLTIPPDPGLVGGTLYLQGLDATSFTFTNAAGMLFH